MADTGRGGINSTSTLTVDSKEWLVLQPLWDVVLANSYYTSSPLFFVLIADGFFFVCIIPYMILDFYGLYHWGWVKRYAMLVILCYCVVSSHVVDTQTGTRPRCPGIIEFNVPLDTVKVISETGALSSDVHLPFSNGWPAT